MRLAGPAIRATHPTAQAAGKAVANVAPSLLGSGPTSQITQTQLRPSMALTKPRMAISSHRISDGAISTFSKVVLRALKMIAVAVSQAKRWRSWNWARGRGSLGEG